MKQRTQSTYIFGTHAVIESILAGKNIEKVLLAKHAKTPLHKQLHTLMQAHNIPYSYVPTEKLHRITTKNHQGVVALLAPIAFASLSQIIQTSYERGNTPLVLLLDGITDVRNFGAIVRTASCTAVDAVIVPHHGSAAISGEAMKTSAGALAHLPICRVTSLHKAMHYLQASGLQIVACHEKAPNSLYNTQLDFPMALLLGAEDQGIHPHHLEIADLQVSIPIWGPVASLNVATAAAVALYEHRRQQPLH